MRLIPLLFILATGDTIPVRVWQQVQPKGPLVAQVSFPWRGLPFTCQPEFQRDSGAATRPEDYSRADWDHGVVEFDISLDGTTWRVCRVTCDGDEIGRFIVPPPRGRGGRGGKVEDAK